MGPNDNRISWVIISHINAYIFYFYVGPETEKKMCNKILANTNRYKIINRKFLNLKVPDSLIKSSTGAKMPFFP